MPKGKIGDVVTEVGNKVTTVVNTVKTTSNTVANTVVDNAKRLGNEVEDKTTTGIDMVKGVVDKHTYSLGKDETIHSKGGTVKGFDQAESMVTVDPQTDAEQRFTELEDLLFRMNAKGGPKLREGTLDLFNKITPRLAGGGVLRGWATKQVGSQMTLEDALRESFKNVNRDTGDYLVDMLVNNGVPSPMFQILDVTGNVSVKQVDYNNRDEMIEAICSGMTRKQYIDLRDDLKARGRRVPDHVKVQAGNAEFMENLHKERSRNEERKKKGKSESHVKEDEWLHMWDDRLADAVTEQCKKDKYSFDKATSARKPVLEKKRIANIVSTVRGILEEIIADEIELDRVGDVRKYLETNHGNFEIALSKIGYINAELRTRLINSVSSKDKTKLLTKFDKKAPDPNETDEKREVRETKQRQEDAKNLSNVSLARELMGQKTFTPEEIKAKGGLHKIIKKMTPEARRMLVASYLDRSKRAQYLNPSTKVSVLNALFEEAWETNDMRKDVEDALFTKDKLDKIAKSQKEKKTEDAKEDVRHLKGKVVLIHSMLRFAGDAGPNYLALVEVSNNKLGTRLSTTTHGTRIWEIAQRAKGSEIYQIRNDLPLLLRLRKLCKNDFTKPSVTNWDKIVDMFNLPATLKLKGADKENPTTLENLTVENKGPDDSTLRGDETMSEAYQKVADGVEFTPNFWKMHLHRLVKMAFPSTSDTYSVVTRAQMAAKRWVSFEQTRRQEEYDKELQQAEDNGTDPPKRPKTPKEAEFMRQIYDVLDEPDQKSLQKKIPHAYEALANGVHLSTDTRLERASGWKVGGSQTSLNTNKAAIVASFEDLNGRELMKEWSNFGDLKKLHKKRTPLIDELNDLDPNDEDNQERISEIESELDGLNDSVARYWPSINRGKLAYIEDNLAGGTRTEIIGYLSNKLASAMKGDTEFIDAAKEAGLTADDYDAERLMFGHMMNKRRQLDTGVQFGARSQFGALRSIREMTTNPLELYNFVKNGGNSSINKSTSQNRKAQSNIYLAQVRNTQAELTEVRNDTSLGDDERQKKVESIREQGSEQIKETREELDKRNKHFTKARSELTKAISRILQLLAIAAVSAATFGQGTVAVIVALILSGIAREAAKALVTYAMEGDAYEHKELAKAIIVGAVKGALRAATMELITVMDVASTLVDFTQEGVQGYVDNSMYGNLLGNAMIAGLMRSAITDIPVNSLKYFFEAERPFRDFGRNLDVYLATNFASVTGRQAAAIVGSLANQAGEDINKLFGPPPGARPSDDYLGIAQDTFTQTAQQQVVGLTGRVAMLGKKAKILIKAAMKKIYKKYPQVWKNLANTSVEAIQDQKKKEGKVEAGDLPDEKQMDRLMDLLDEIAAGNKTVDDVRSKDKEMLGILILYAESQGVTIS